MFERDAPLPRSAPPDHDDPLPPDHDDPLLCSELLDHDDPLDRPDPFARDELVVFARAEPVLLERGDPAVFARGDPPRGCPFGLRRGGFCGAAFAGALVAVDAH